MSQAPLGSGGAHGQAPELNPYAAPQGASASAAGSPGSHAEGYVPLGWRTALAAISVLGMTLVDVVMRLAQAALGDALRAGARTGVPDLATVAVLGAAGLGVLALSVASWVFVPVWMHRASSNLRGLGRYGMAFSPAGCAGWFFVPFANLWKPPQAMAEIWRASDPDADQGSWFAAPRSPLIGLWWVTWILSGLVSWGSLLTKDDPSSSTMLGLVSCAFRALAAVSLVALMRGVSSRQERAASRLLAG